MVLGKANGRRGGSQIDAMQEHLALRENTIERPTPAPKEKTAVSTPPAAALAADGRLAGGEPSIWKTLRALKLRPGTLRVRVTGDYRLLFETGPTGTLRFVDFILRRGLDRRLAAGGR